MTTLYIHPRAIRATVTLAIENNDGTESTAIVMIDHDIEIVRQYADSIASVMGLAMAVQERRE